MGDLSSLKELDDFQIYKKFIKRFFLEDQDLFRLVFFQMKNPFDEDKCVYPENPFKIFTTEKEDDNDNHGVVLFGQKNGEILNYGTTVILIDFETTRIGNSHVLDNLYIIFRIITKSEDIQELEDNEGNIVNRSYAIAGLIDNNFNYARVNNVSEIRKQSIKPLSINEQNGGYSIVYKTSAWGSKLLSKNKNYRKQRS